jgi:hypothetical protein
MDIWHEFDFNWLLHLTCLEEIYIHDRYIDDVRPLLKLPNLKSLQLRGLDNKNILLPLVDSNSLESIFVEEEYWSSYIVDIFKERGISIWTDDK